jgi:mannose-6-phosphate isomerase-like protein (cupin superfamily)
MPDSPTTPYTLRNYGTWADLGQHKYGPIEGKAFVKSETGTTSCEISLNRMQAGKGMPFLHAHKQNEEVYVVVSGNGLFHLDGQEFPVSEGSVVRVAPSVARGFQAGSEDLCLICVQARDGSLEQATRDDGIRLEAKASWM